MANSDTTKPTNPHRADDPPLTDAAQADYFDAVLAAADEALRRTARSTVDLDLAGTRCRLCFAGDVMRTTFLPALQHLVIPTEGEPDVVFHIWDSASSGVVMPAPPVPRDCFSNRGDIWRMESTRHRSAFHWIESSVNLFDTERSVGIFWVPGTDLLPFWAKASPFRTLFHWWLERTGAQLVHGAAFGTADGALLLTGKGGVGKSTTALTALSHGLHYIADDYLAIRLDPEPRVYSLYCTAKLDGPQMERFPRLGQLIVNHGFRSSEKAVVVLLPAFAGQIERSLPLRAVCTPEFAGVPETSIRPATRLALQRAATYTTMSQLPHAGDPLNAFMRRLVHAVPGFTLALGTDLERIPAVIRDIVQRTPADLAALTSAEDDVPAERLVSVIIPVFNGAHFLSEAVACVLSQGYPNLEILVIDDGSTDDLASAIRALPVEVRLLHQENAGPAAARNRGIRDAGGEYIAFLDVDDLWPEGNLPHLVQLLEASPELMVVHGRSQVMRRAEDGTNAYVGDPGEAFAHYIGAGLYRRAAFSTVGLFDATLRFGEDADWFMRAGEAQLRIEKLDEICLHVRRHGANMTLGKTMTELNSLRVLKLALERRRAQQAAAASDRDAAS